jgi:glycosyltransferase involved in cell wall biosynthesis
VPKVFYLSESVPNRDPQHGDGSSMIPYEVIRAMSASARITLLTFTEGMPVPAVVADHCVSHATLPLRTVAAPTVRAALLGAQLGAQQRASAAAHRAVAELSRQADVTLVHGPHAAFLAHSVVGPLVVQVVDPWSLRLGMEAGLVSGWRAHYRAMKARQALSIERKLPGRARLLTISRADALKWSSGLGRSVTAIANGVSAVPPSRAPNGPPTVCFTGSLSYPPNIDSAHFLISEIAALVWKRQPEMRFVIAGRQPDQSVLSLASERVTVLGNVRSMDEVFQAATVAVFPDRVGVGIRNSVSEAIASGVPTIATSTAAREQEAHPLLTVVDDLDGFVEAVLDVVEGRTAERDSAPTPAPRTWEEVADEYWAQCVSAIAAESETRIRPELMAMHYTPSDKRRTRFS